MTTRRVDSNHSEIVAALRKAGAVVIDIHTVPGALDLIVAHRGELHIMEVKRGVINPRLHLTPKESKTIDALAHVGVQAILVTSAEQALKRIGAM